MIMGDLPTFSKSAIVCAPLRGQANTFELNDREIDCISGTKLIPFDPTVFSHMYMCDFCQVLYSKAMYCAHYVGQAGQTKDSIRPRLRFLYVVVPIVKERS